MGLLAAAGLIGAGLFSAFAGQQPVRSAGTVVVIPITGTVDDGMDHLVVRSIAAAQSSGASAIGSGAAAALTARAAADRPTTPAG